MTTIDHFNKRLGDDLGRIGANPRFAWKLARDIHYYTRTGTAIEFTRHAWSERIGDVWVIAQFHLPTSFDPGTGQTTFITREQWWASFGGEMPYPESGIYHAHPETKLAPSVLPDEYETAVMIASIRAQMEKPYDQHLRECTKAAEQSSTEHEKQFFAEAEEFFPAFWKDGQGHEPGTRGSHVSFGGVDHNFDPDKGLYLPQ